MKVAFRVDASSHMGIGHFMRCLTLAEALRERGADVRFVCRAHVGHMIAMLTHLAIPVTVLPAPITTTDHTEDYAVWLGVAQEVDAAEAIEALNGERPDWLVVDHYGLDAQWEQRLRPYVVKLMVIDDLADRHHDCDLLLNQNYSDEGEPCYQGLVPENCCLLLGVQYALLRREFQIMRHSLKAREGKLESVLVFFTAGDDQGETLKAMIGVHQHGGAKIVDVVVGHSNSRKEEIRKLCASRNWNYHCQIDYMAKLIAQADIVIGAGGSSNWERCALGAPALVTILAENQAPIAQALGRIGAVCNLGWGRDLQAADYANALSTLNQQRLAAMSEQALQLVDARGAERIADVLFAAQSEVAEQSKWVP